MRPKNSPKCRRAFVLSEISSKSQEIRRNADPRLLDNTVPTLYCCLALFTCIYNFGLGAIGKCEVIVYLVL